MPASRPRRKKLIRLIIILSGFVEAALDNEQDGTSWETLLNQIADLKTMMATDDAEWTEPYSNAWAVIENLVEAVDPESPTQLDEAGAWAYSYDLQDAIDEF